ncbi:UNVERIFIED_CONTAM: hypothetical protein HHA_456400 [Hammondia hammondi]|eukprot:XP_008888956.1 hypothetical protein HHA_456400 [Hammondia hammondi]
MLKCTNMALNQRNATQRGQGVQYGKAASNSHPKHKARRLLRMETKTVRRILSENVPFLGNAQHAFMCSAHCRMAGN